MKLRAAMLSEEFGAAMPEALAKLPSFFFTGGTVDFQKLRKNHGVCQTMGNTILPTQTVSDAVNIAYIGAAESAASQICRLEHTLSCFPILPVLHSPAQIAMNQCNGFLASLLGQYLSEFLVADKDASPFRIITAEA